VREPSLPLQREILPRLRNSPTVKQALRRLARHGNLKIQDAEEFALDRLAPIDQRLDATTVVTAMKEGHDSVLRALLRGDDPTVFIEALKRIRNFRTEWAKPVLLNALRTSRDPSKRPIFAWALAAYPKDIEVEGALLRIATRDNDSNVRAHAIESLGQFHSGEVIDALCRILQRGSPTERYWALYSLGTLADLRAAEMVSRLSNDQTEIPGFGTIADEAQRALTMIAAARKRSKPKRHGPDN
jgi:HEAT repeat protein